MVVDKTLDKYLADIIFTTACNGFEYDAEVKRFHFRISHITEQMFCNMADCACKIKKKLTVESVNNLLQWTQKDAFYYDEIRYSLPVSLLSNGESIRIKFMFDGEIFFADLMKMTESEFLILHTDLRQFQNILFMQIYENENIGKEKIIYIHSCGNVLVLQTWLIKPLDYYSYTDWHFMRDLWRYNINENLWYTYNSLFEYVNNYTTWRTFLDVIDIFKKNGLSTFVFRLMLNSVKR